MDKVSKLLVRLKEIDKEIVNLEHVIAAVDWDQQTYMPQAAGNGRAEQLALLESVAHQRNTSAEIGEILNSIGADDDHPEGAVALSEQDKAFVREVRRRYAKLVKLPESLVTAFARERSLAQSVWVQAKESNDFSQFAPNLERLVGLSREIAECYGYEDHIYDALLDTYEPEMKEAEVTAVFERLAASLQPLVAAIADAPQVRTDFLEREFPPDLQEKIGRQILQDIGFDFIRGRLDVSAHPFTTTLGSHDIRLTTNYSPNFLPKSLFGSIHEGGHGMYEQGISKELHGSVLAEGTSLGIHESQSRSWENIIGRSLPFWKHYYPDLMKCFPQQLQDVTLDDFYRGINAVAPSFIRIEADEVTYNLHIILRFELEKLLLTGDLKVRDLPSAWNEKMETLLGITVPRDSVGVLQDVHWSAGLFGYFPTYALGNLYGAQFAAKIRELEPGLDDKIADGDFSPVLSWQRENIHPYGKMYSAGELCEKATGKRLDPGYFVTYLNEKFKEIYEL